MTDHRSEYDVGGVLLERPFKIDRLGHLGLYLEDLPGAQTFFGDVLGFRCTDVLGPAPGFPANRGYFYTHCTDHHSLALIGADVARSRDDRYARGITVNQLSFQVGTLDEMVHAYRLLKDRGRSIWRVGRDRPGSNYAVYFQDPDGHTVELFYGMEQIGWDGRSKPMDVFAHLGRTTEPELPQAAELDEVLAAQAKGADLGSGHRAKDMPDGTYVVGGIKLPRPFRIVRTGPIDLFVEDMDAAVRFYAETLGLRVSETTQCDGERCVFLRAGGEHHTIGLIPLSLRTGLSLSTHTTVASIGIQVGSYRQLLDAVSFLHARGCSEVDLPASLHPGIDYAAHFVGPEGHLVRLYYDMERIGWDGKPRPAELRPSVRRPWPDVLSGVSDPYAQRCFMGPLG
ncbi:VOC family protein [Piscinibacter sp.]|uniref:VOC family protein n=1 Tax=Piscinibacter sp. TaxID=1903157 RepID=UPI0039E7016A